MGSGLRDDAPRVIAAIAALVTLAVAMGVSSIPSRVTLPASEAEALAAQADRLAADGNADAAIAPLLRLQRTHPQTVAYVHQLAVLYGGAGRHDAEAEAWERFMASSPRPEQACPHLPIAYQRQGQATRALAAFDKCLELAAAEAGILTAAAAAHEAAGNTARARAIHEQALAANPSSIDHIVALSRLSLAAGDVPAAHAMAQRAVATDPQSVRALHAMARALVALDQPHEARLHLERAQAIAPDNAELELVAGMIEEAESNLEAALNRYNRALALDRNLAEARERRDALRRRR